MTLTFEQTPTKVPISEDQAVSVAPGQPWPSAYRGSQYSLVSDDDFGDDVVLKWEQRDLSIHADPPTDLWTAMNTAGKEDGYGSFRVTAQGEVLTKVKADNYANTDQAPVSTGWIPAYLGKLNGTLDFGSVDTDPDPPENGIAIWQGFPFKHGERWAVSHDDQLIWKWRDYRFTSIFDHSELIAAYDEYRPNPGRLYVTEHGHIWINVPHNDVTQAKGNEVQQAISTWKQRAETNDNTSTLRLVNRRLVATSQSDDPADGHLPIHLGHLRDFDDGLVPRPVVDDDEYFLEVGQYEEVWE
ncbi:hypothetical protein [Halorhabdus rudnickae]|uniref:hypothetical protein n=1 Tax=Halorhabdus rudnickae TaxID=1775544 RepID=UPI001082992B|nr:hypothetical protein [Halorhabdus rudnickae]